MIPTATPRFPGMASPKTLQPTTNRAFPHQICDITGQTGSSYSSDYIIDIKTIPTATPSFPGMASPKAPQLTTNLAFLDRFQIRRCKPEVVTTQTRLRMSRRFQPLYLSFLGWPAPKHYSRQRIEPSYIRFAISRPKSEVVIAQTTL